MAEPHDNFVKNWKPEGVTAMNPEHINGLAQLPVEGAAKPAEGSGTDGKPAEDSKPAGELTKPADAAADVAANEAQKALIEKASKDISSLTADEKAAYEKIKPSETSVKSFEQLLEERSKGKFKTYDELETLLTPKKHEYKSALAERLDTYIEQGGMEEDFIRTQTTDYTKMSPKALIEHKIQLEHPKMSPEEVEYEMESRYKMDQWKTDPKDYEDGKEPKEIRILKLKYEREAQEAKDLFIAEQKKWAVPEKKDVKPVAPDHKIQEKWNQDIDTAISKLDKFPLQITDTEKYDFVMDAKDKAELSQIAKDLNVNAAAFWDKTGVRYKDADGKFKINQEKLTEVMYKAMSFDKAIKAATIQAREKAKEGVVKDLKNIDMKPGDAKPAGTKELTVAQQIAQQGQKELAERSRGR